jgi:hypothetical protein
MQNTGVVREVRFNRDGGVGGVDEGATTKAKKLVRVAPGASLPFRNDSSCDREVRFGSPYPIPHQCAC